MTTLTVNIKEERDHDSEYAFSKTEIESLMKTKRDFLDGKTTARDWKDIEQDLNSAYN